MNPFWSQNVGELMPYVPGEQPADIGIIKLNTNESPFPPSPAAMEAIACVSADELRRYPDPEAWELRGAIATAHGLSAEQIFVGNGSDEVLAHAFPALLRQRGKLYLPDISYKFYDSYCRLFEVGARKIPLDESFNVDSDLYDFNAGSVLIANPNAPTGISMSREALHALLAKYNQIPVVVDEAYADFNDWSADGLVPHHPNLLVVRTFSKAHGLAGLRVGYALGHPELIEALSRVKNSFNSYPVGALAQAAARAAIQDRAYLAATLSAVRTQRRRLTAELDRLGFSVLPSAANFILASHPSVSGIDLYQGLWEKSILVRHFQDLRLENHVRITIGDEPQMDRLITIIREIIAARAAERPADACLQPSNARSQDHSTGPSLRNRK